MRCGLTQSSKNLHVPLANDAKRSLTLRHNTKLRARIYDAFERVMPNSQGGEPFLFEGVQVIAPLDLRLGMSKKPFTDMTWDSKRGKARPACAANVVNSPGLEGVALLGKLASHRVI